MGDWPPFLSEDLAHQGIAARIIRDVFAEAGYETQFAFYPWARALENARSGSLDGTAVWLKTAEREHTLAAQKVSAIEARLAKIEVDIQAAADRIKPEITKGVAVG